jgi:cation transport ATPase
MILVHLLLRFVFHLDQQHAAIPLFAGLAASAPLVLDLLRKLVHFQFGSDLIAGISIVSAVLMHEYLVACVVALMLSGGQALETYATRRASSVLQALARRMPAQAHLVEGSSFRNISADQIQPGDLFLVLAHEICPVDGEVVEGHSRMDESFLTGEPFELSKAPGSRVISGAVNAEAVLKVRALRLAADSRYARILRVLRETEQTQPQMRPARCLVYAPDAGYCGSGMAGKRQPAALPRCLSDCHTMSASAGHSRGDSWRNLAGGASRHCG